MQLFDEIVYCLLRGHYADISSIDSMSKDTVIKAYTTAVERFIGGECLDAISSDFGRTLSSFIPEIYSRALLINKKKQSNDMVYPKLEERFLKKGLLSSKEPNLDGFFYGIGEAFKRHPFILFDPTKEEISHPGNPYLYLDIFDIDMVIDNLFDKHRDIPLIPASIFIEGCTLSDTKFLHRFHIPYYILPFIIRDAFITDIDEDILATNIAAYLTPMIHEDEGIPYFQDRDNNYSQMESVYSQEIASFGLDQYLPDKVQTEAENYYNSQMRHLGPEHVILPQREIYFNRVNAFRDSYIAVKDMIPKAILYKEPQRHKVLGAIKKAQQLSIKYISETILKLHEHYNVDTPIIRVGNILNTKKSDALIFSKSGLDVAHTIGRLEDG